MFNNSINHLAIIMDGNARYAKKNKIISKDGYLAGLKKINEVIDICIEKKIKHLTIYALSTENIKRSSINVIFEILNSKYDEIFAELSNNNNIRIKIIGEKDNLPNNILIKLKDLEMKTSKNKILNLNVAFNYGFMDELIYLIKNIINTKNKNRLIINEKLIKKNLYLSNTPNPDLLIRTGGFSRLSNFFLLQLSYSELFFTKTLWPELSKKEILDIFDQFKKIKRNYGL